MMLTEKITRTHIEPSFENSQIVKNAQKFIVEREQVTKVRTVVWQHSRENATKGHALMTSRSRQGKSDTMRKRQSVMQINDVGKNGPKVNSHTLTQSLNVPGKENLSHFFVSASTLHVDERR